MPSIHDLSQAEKDDLMSLDINPISPLKMKFINELRERAKEITSSYSFSEHAVSDITLLRFVRGYEFNIDEAFEAYKNMLMWRKDNKIEEYFEKVKEVDFDVHKVPYANEFESCFHTNYFHKTDKEGHIVDIRLMGSIDVKAMLSHTLKEWLDYNIYTLEWRIHTLNKRSIETGHLQRLCCIQDLKGVGMHMISPTLITYLKEMAHTTSHNYPEVMHRSFIVNVPSIFSYIWGLAKPVMHPRTVKKIVICKGDYLPSLLEDIPIQNLPTYLGGFCKCQEGCLCKLENDEKFNIYVSSKLEIPVSLKKGQTFEWDWKLDSGNIDVTHTFEQKELFKGDRIAEHKGQFTAETDGTFTILFDNSFSWVNGKTVIGVASIQNCNVCLTKIFITNMLFHLNQLLLLG